MILDVSGNLIQFWEGLIHL